MSDVSFSFHGDPTDAARAAEQVERALEELSRQALETGATMRAALTRMHAPLDDTKDKLDSATGAMGRHDAATKRLTRSTGDLEKSILRTNRGFAFFRNIISVIRWPALITAVGFFAQAVAAAAAGIVALGAALTPLVGVFAALPATLGILVGAVVGTKLAFSDLKEALDGNAKAIARLTPEGRRFAAVLNGLKPLIRDLRRESQKGLFPGLEAGLRGALTQRNVQTARGFLGGATRAVGQAAAGAGRALGQRGGDLAFLSQQNLAILNRFSALVPQLTKALISLTVAAQPLVNHLAGIVEQFTRWLSRSIETGRATGSLNRFFQQTADTLDDVIDLAVKFGGALVNIGKAGGAALGRRMIRDLADAADQFERFTASARGQNAIANYFERAQAPIYETARLLRDMTIAFARLGTTPGLAQLIRLIRIELVPAFEQLLGQSTRAFGPALVRALTNVLRLLAQFAGPTGPLTVMVEAIADVSGALADFGQQNPRLVRIAASFASIVAMVKALSFATAILGIARFGRAVGITRTRVRALNATVATTGTTATASSAVAVGAMGRIGLAAVRLGRVIRFVLIRTGLGLLVVAAGEMAYQLIFHMDRVKAAWTRIWAETTVLAYKAFLKIIEPFSHLPHHAGQWARNLKVSVLGQLHSLEQEMALAGESAGTAWGMSFVGAASRTLSAVQTPGVEPGSRGGGGVGRQTIPRAGRGPRRIASTAIEAASMRGASAAGFRFGRATRRPQQDCSSFTQEVYRQNGISIGGVTTSQWAGAPTKSKKKEGIQVGDLVFFYYRNGTSPPPDHVGIYLGGGMMVDDHGQSSGVTQHGVDWGHFYGWARYTKTGVDTAPNIERTPPTPPPDETPGPAYGFTPTPVRATGTPARAAGRATAAERAPLQRQVAGLRRQLVEIVPAGVRRRLQRELSAIGAAIANSVTDADLNRIRSRLDRFRDQIRNAVTRRERAAVERQLRGLAKQLADVIPEGVQEKLEQRLEAIRRSIRSAKTDQALAAAKDRLDKWKDDLREALDLSKEIRDLRTQLDDLRTEILKLPEVMRGRLLTRMAEINKILTKKIITSADLERVRTLLDGLTEAVTTAADKWQEQLDRMTAAMDELRDRTTEIWGKVAQKALDVFDAATDEMVKQARKPFEALTPAEQALDELERRRAALAREDDMATAESELAYAVRTGDPDLIRQAQNRITELQLDAEANRLGVLADAERKAADEAADREEARIRDERALTRERFEERLDETIRGLIREGATYEQAMNAIMGVLNEFGVDAAAAGSLVGAAFAQGFMHDMGMVASFLDQLRGKFQEFIDLTTPPIDGWVSRIAARFNDLLGPLGAISEHLQRVINLARGSYNDILPIIGGGGGQPIHIPLLQHGGVVTRPTLAMVGDRGHEAVIPLDDPRLQAMMGGGGGTTSVTFNFDRYVGNRRELEREMISALREYDSRNGRVPIRVSGALSSRFSTLARDVGP